MNIQKQLIQGFSKEETTRMQTHLDKLLPYLTSGQFTIVGGLAIRYHLVSKGIPYPHRPFNDLDIIAQSRSVVSHLVTKDFLVEHYHPFKDNHFYIVLIDPVSKTKVDIFDNTMAPFEVVTVPFGKYLLQVQSIEDQLVKTVVDIRRLSQTLKVDPKQFQDARLLLSVANLQKAETFWQRKNLGPQTLFETLLASEKIAHKHPEYVQEKPFRKEKPYVCPDCVSTSDFPITPMENIYTQMGYIE